MKTVRYLGLVSFALLLVTNACDGADTMVVGETLSGGQTLTSVNGTFKLGFFNLNNMGNWYLGIWYAQMPVMTVVWVANTDNPLKNNSGTLDLSKEGSLVLSFGSSVIWSTFTSKASSVLITDAGNLIIYGANTSEIAWESFNYPGNTWLPGMKLTASQKLIAWKSPWDPSPGRYSLQMDPDGSNEFMLMLCRSVKYWESGVWKGQSQIFSNVPEMTQNFIYNFSFFDNGTYKYFTYSVKETANMLSRLVLSEVGNIQVYSISSGSSDWYLFWVQPRDQCDVDTLCGGYASCGANNVQSCRCLEGFTPADKVKWQARVWSGCVRRTALDCQTVDSTTTRTTDGFIKITGKESPVDSVDTAAENCREECLRKCSCTAYVDVGGGMCRRWFGDLVNLKDGWSNSTTAKDLFVRVAARDVPKTGWKKTTVAGVVVALIVAVTVPFYLFYYRRRKSRRTSEYVPASLTVFSYRELKVITKNFSERIGGGGFGSVFKGTLPDKSHVAVKKLEGSSQGEKQFRAEVSTTGIIQHVNLIRLRGFCSEGAHRLLVYDYMPNGSLNSFLFLRPGKESTTLDWKTRFNIALGTARGILYLHDNCRDCIIHCDIKPENILLDSDFCPKVADFGLAKLVGRDFSHVLTTLRGTRGYLAPEWVFGLPITPKADVYSFGMTLLEIIAGRRNMDIHPEFSEVYFPTWAAIQINAGNSVGLLDKRLDSNADAEQVRRAAMVGGWCIQDDEDARPSMREVVQILEGNGDVTVPPVPMSLEGLVADPSSLMGCWDKEMEAASLSLASSGRVSFDPPPSTA